MPETVERLGAPRTAVLRTPRLTLRRLDTADASFVRALLNDPAWLANIGDRGVRDDASALAWIAKGPDAGFAANGFSLLACDLADGTTIGICGLIRRAGLDDVDLGYALLPQYRGQGFAEEAARAALTWAREAHHLGRVVAIVGARNEPSRRVLARCGFCFERDIVLPGDREPVELHAVDLSV